MTMCRSRKRTSSIALRIASSAVKDVRRSAPSSLAKALSASAMKRSVWRSRIETRVK
jgi:hypothetical protein